MQVFCQHSNNRVRGHCFDMAMLSETKSDHFEIKEKRSSDASFVMMNPVASGDNVTTTVLNSAHKLKEELPPLVPCCEGKELQINEDVIHSGLSAISVRHDSLVPCLSLSRANESFQLPPGTVKHRNSFRSLHRPDLKRVPYLRRMTADELETLFKGYADISTNCDKQDDKNTQDVKPPPQEQQTKPSATDKLTIDDGGTPLHPIIPNQSKTEDVPAGMRLHGARARLYTSVLAGDKPGDQAEGLSLNDELMYPLPVDEPLPEDEIPLHEELQIILPPRCDDVIVENQTPDSGSNVS